MAISEVAKVVLVVHPLSRVPSQDHAILRTASVSTREMRWSHARAQQNGMIGTCRMDHLGRTPSSDLIRRSVCRAKREP